MMRKRSLMTTCAACALLAALAAPAAAQSFAGTPTVVAGSAAVTTGPGVTDIQVAMPETVINWQANDPASTGLVNFQPGGIATFNEAAGVQDYTVLNRILPVDGVGNPIDSVVSFNGLVQSFLKGVPGGQIWFYSPAGIIVGPSSVFNVGSLILTTDDIQFKPLTSPPDFGSIYGTGGLVQFIGPAGSTGFIDVQAGAQLNATGANAYLALVAPRVVQAGTVFANGPIAYLAAEQVDMTIGAGLFDFVLTVGTGDANGVVHSPTGTTTGPFSTGAADLQRIAMIALPKNQALTMLLAGSIGYTPAALAANEGSSVVLAAGFDTAKPTALPGNTLGQIEIRNATFRNALTGYASDAVAIAPVAGTTAFQANAALYGRNAISVTAQTGEQVNATNDLLLRSGVPGAGGAIDVQALGTGLIDVAGTLGADASSGAAVFVPVGGYLDAVGGTVAFTADGGTINAANLFAGAEAFGAFGDSRGGIGTGGTVGVTIANGGTLAAGPLSLSTNGLGGPSARSGGDGVGGTANLTLNAGTLTAATVSIESNGGGGPGSASPVATPYQSGHGTGGTSRFTQNAGIANVTTLTLQSDGAGGEPGPPATGTDLAALAGNGTGGTALLSLAGGFLTTTDTTIQALGIGADGMDHAGTGAATDGGIGTGGAAALQSPAGSTNAFSATTLTMLANGQGGDGGGSAGGANGNGGNGAGFSAAADLANGSFTLGSVTLQSTGTGGFGALGGEGSGATARFAVIDAAGPSGARSIASLDVDASGFGGMDPSGGTAASDAGQIELTAQVLDAGSALDFTGDLTLTNTGTRSAVGNGIAIAVGGAPLTIGGNITMTTTRDVAIAALEPLRSFGNIDVNARAFASTGLVDADGTLSILGTDGIAAERLESGGTTLLQAINGPVTVSIDLASAGAVTALGQSIDVTSLGALTIADAQATAGDLRFAVTGDLTAGPTQATGTATLSSTGGAFVATSPVNSGGALAITGNAGVNAGTVTSGGTTALQSANGAVIVGTLNSAGLVTAQGASLDLQSPGSLAFASAQASAGDLSVQAAGNLDVAVAGATGSLQLVTPGGNVVTGDLTAGTWAYVGAAGGATLGNIVAGTDATASTFAGNLTVGNVTAGDEIWLSVFGADLGRVLTAGNLTSTGLGDDAAAGPPILFGGPGPTGNVTRVRSSGSLAVGNVQTPGRAILVADNGAIGAGAVTAPEAAILLASGNIALTGATTAGKFYVGDSTMFAILPPAYDPASLDGAVPIVNNGSLTVNGTVNAGTVFAVVGGDATIGAVASGGTTDLLAALGTVDVDNLLSAGPVRAYGGSVDIASTGALSFADLDATAGALSVQTAGNLTLATADAANAVTLRSTGGALTASGAINARGSVVASGLNGVTVPTLNSGATTQLIAVAGTVDIDSLTSTGAVTARGRSVDIVSPGVLTFADLDATAGNAAVVTTGYLVLPGADVTGTLTLSSATGGIFGSGVVNVGGAVSATALSGVTFGTLSSGGTTLLRGTGDPVHVDNLLSAGAVTARGSSVDIASSGGLSFADVDATIGDVRIATVGILALTTVDSAYMLTLSSSAGSVTATGAVNSPRSADISGAAGVSLALLAPGGVTTLQSSGGAIDVDEFLSARSLSATGRSIDIASTGAANFSFLNATAGNIALATAGSLSVGTADATGTITLTSAGDTIRGDRVNTGGAFSAVAPLGVAFGTVVSGGTTFLQANTGHVDVFQLRSTGAVTARGQSVSLGSDGALTFADLDATAGALVVQTAGNLTLATADATGAVTLRSTGGAFRSTGSVNGASIALTASGGVQADANLAAAGNLTVDAGGTFTLAGLARGTVITARSSDIAVGPSARIGVRGVTQDVTLTNANPARVTFIGGAADPAGYSLDQAEILRVFADRSIALTSAGDVTIRNLGLAFGATGNIGTGGRLEVTTPARVSIAGNVALTTTGADDSFLIDPTRIELNTDTGSIALLSAAGAPLGRLAMTGNTVAVATAGVLTQLAAAPSFAAVNALLDQPGGNPQPLRAGTMTLNVVDALLIQNSGLSALYRDRAGFAAAGLGINTASANTRIAVNGQILAPGGPVTGLDTQTLVTINGAPAAAGGQFAPGSTINGCVIGGTCAPPPGSGPPSDADLVEPLPPDGSPPSLFIAPLIELAGTEPLITPPLVDEPITGVGNDDLWEPRCGSDDEDVCPEADDRP